MSYYDGLTGEVIFRNFRIGQAGQLGGTNNRLFNQAAPTDAQNRAYDTAYTNLAANTGNSGNGDTTSRKAAAAGASNHFAMAVDSTDRVILAYYDESSAALVLKYSNALDGSDPTANIVWTDSRANSALPLYVGMYVSMIIDSGNHLHIAAYDALDSTLKFIYIDNFAAGNSAAAGVAVVTVDQYGSVGNWTDIKMHPAANRPYIAYYNATETGGRDAVKIAWAKKPVTGAASALPGVDKNGYTNGNWEYRTVPAVDPPQGGSNKFQKVNLDFRPNGDPILGYLAQNIEFSYQVGE
jgi:hypothetical protein